MSLYFHNKRLMLCRYFQFFVGGCMSYLCLLACSGVQHILYCVFLFFFFVLCTLSCQYPWIVLLWLPLRYYLTFFLNSDKNTLVNKHVRLQNINLRCFTSEWRNVFINKVCYRRVWCIIYGWTHVHYKT